MNNFFMLMRDFDLELIHPFSEGRNWFILFSHILK